MFLFSLLVACRPHIGMVITVPAEVSIDASVTSIAIVDRVSDEYSRKSIAGFLASSQTAKTVRFQIVDAQQVYNDLTVPVNGPIPKEAMRELCDKAKVTGALVLHRFNKDEDTNVSESIKTKTVDGKSKNYTVYTATYSATVTADWRFQGCNGETYDSFEAKNWNSWSGEGVTPGDAKSNLGNTDKLALELADDLGDSYFSRVAPTEKGVSRTPYRGPIGSKGKRFRNGTKLMESKKWYQAEKIYTENMAGFTGKVEGKAHYNLAITYEALNNLDSMVEHAKQADAILQSRKSADYLSIAQERKKQEQKLQNQMQKAVEVNSQQND